jgi:hypothetical protein
MLAAAVTSPRRGSRSASRATPATSNVRRRTAVSIGHGPSWIGARRTARYDLEMEPYRLRVGLRSLRSPCAQESVRRSGPRRSARSTHRGRDKSEAGEANGGAHAPPSGTSRGRHRQRTVPRRASEVHAQHNGEGAIGERALELQSAVPSPASLPTIRCGPPRPRRRTRGSGRSRARSRRTYVALRGESCHGPSAAAKRMKLRVGGRDRARARPLRRKRARGKGGRAWSVTCGKTP